MLSYSDIYEILRKEKYSENLQKLSDGFIGDVSDYLKEKRLESTKDEGLFADSVSKSKKQFENSIALFRELMLRRKKKLLNLVFVAAETGIMKRDYENMLSFEKEVFDKLVKVFEDCDKEVSKHLNGKKGIEEAGFKMIMFNQNVEQFVDMNGNVMGPYSSGELVNLDSKVAEILVSSGKAGWIDE